MGWRRMAPDLVRSVLLVDGGVGLDVPPGLDIDAVVEAMSGPARRQLRMTFPSRLAYTEVPARSSCDSR